MIFSPHPYIPTYAKQVFSGVRSEIYQWNQELYDGTYTPFERIRFMDGAFTVGTTRDQKILITRQEQPCNSHFFSFPWGGLESGEDPLDGARREFLEETGYASDTWIHWHTDKGGKNIASFTYFYIARDCEKIQEIQWDPGEKIELFEYDFDAFLLLSEDTTFVHNKSILHTLYQARLYPEKYRELRTLLFWEDA